MVYLTCGLAVLGSLAHPAAGFWRQAVLGGVTGFSLLLMAYLGGKLFIRSTGKHRDPGISGPAFGLGDAQIGMLIGLMLGYPQVVSAIVVSVFLAGAGAILLLITQALIHRRVALFQPMPYAPYLAIGTLLTWILELQLADLLAGG